MFENLINRIKREYKFGNLFMKLIIINVGVYLFASVLNVLMFLFTPNSAVAGGSQNFQNFLFSVFAVPSNISDFIFRPWSIFSYMFLHLDFFHLLFNMVTLYFMGKIFMIYLTEKQFKQIYFLGGIFGAAFFLLMYNTFPAFETAKFQAIAVGASAAVMAVSASICTYAPDFEVKLYFSKPVKIKFILIGLVLLDIISIPQGNAGGHIAHLGGVLFGILYSMRLKTPSCGKSSSKSKKWSNPLNDYLNKRKYENAQRAKKKAQDKAAKAQKKKMDEVLKKVSESGYNSLTKEEKEMMFGR